MSEKTSVVVIGGGAAGLIAAWRAAERGADVLLLEKGKRLGTKILISGGGKCNLTHAGPMEDVRKAFRQNEASFLKASFLRFTNNDFLDILHRKGMETYVRPDGRIFPVPPADAHTVMEVLEAVVRASGVKIRRESPVEGLLVEAHGYENRVAPEPSATMSSGREVSPEGHRSGTLRSHAPPTCVGVRLVGGEEIRTTKVILATGGSSFPATGCTGDGWRWAEALGHTIVKLTAALAPLYLAPTPEESLNGVPIRDGVLKARKINPDGSPGKERMRWRGDMVFTYKGVSGPVALGVSREIAEALPENSLVEADFLPDESFENLTARLLAWTKASPRQRVSTFVDACVPERLVRPLLETAQVSPDTAGAYLTAKERNRLALTIKGWNLGAVRAVPLERGEVVAGGVSLSEVSASTMESKRVKGLYLCGEVLDIAGPVGGYNLQAAWSTGFVAGDSAAG